MRNDKPVPFALTLISGGIVTFRKRKFLSNIWKKERARNTEAGDIDNSAMSNYNFKTLFYLCYHPLEGGPAT
jgi:hypothetical protein